MRLTAGLTLLALTLPVTALANEPISARGAWEGRVDFFTTGTVLAVDTDGDFRVDTSAQPASITVAASDASGDVEAAWVYWGGSQLQPTGGACTSGSDDTIDVTLPAGNTIAVTADDCFCSDGGASFYDVWTCRADLTAQVMASGGQITGAFTVDGYDGLFQNGSTHNASAMLLLVYGDNSLPPRRVAAFDGNIDLAGTEQLISLDGIEVDSIPSGDLAYYVLEGDISGGGIEEVGVQSLPGGISMLLSDAVNPVSNPFNQTINTTTPPMTGLVGVDIDRFDITSALAAGDDEVEVRIAAGDDKIWLAATIVGVDLFDPAFRRNTTKSVALFVDQNLDGFANPGDTLRYTIRLENDGNEMGTVNLRDPVPSEFASFTVVDSAGGSDSSSASEVRIDSISVPAGASRSVIIDMVVDDVPDGVAVINTASWTAPLQGGLAGMVSSVATEIKNPMVDPDMGMGGDDMGMGGDDMGMGGGDMGMGGDMGTGDDDMGGSGADMASNADMAGSPNPDAGAPNSDSGTGSGGGEGGEDGDGSDAPSGSAKELSDGGCCATAGRGPMSAGWMLLVALVLAGRRRRR